MQMETQPGVAIGYKAEIKQRYHGQSTDATRACGRARRGLGRLGGENQRLTGGDDRSEGPRSGVVR